MVLCPESHSLLLCHPHYDPYEYMCPSSHIIGDRCYYSTLPCYVPQHTVNTTACENRCIGEDVNCFSLLYLFFATTGGVELFGWTSVPFAAVALDAAGGASSATTGFTVFSSVTALVSCPAIAFLPSASSSSSVFAFTPAFASPSSSFFSSAPAFSWESI